MNNVKKVRMRGNLHLNSMYYVTIYIVLLTTNIDRTFYISYHLLMSCIPHDACVLKNKLTPGYLT